MDADKNEMRILFTCVGRRVELIEAFHNASNRLGINLRIYGTEISKSAPALFFCDKKEIVCRIKDPDYISQLLEICKREQIDALIPTIDTDLLILSKVKEQFFAIGTRVIVSAEDKVQLCRDKRFTTDYFISRGLKSPRMVDDYTKYNMDFPSFIKPKDGSSSINAFKVNNAKDLEVYAHQVDDYIIQPFIDGIEYTVDIFCDFDGNPIYITPRERVAVHSGEVMKTMICQDDTIINECLKLIDNYKPCGAITVQLIKQKDTGDNYYIEINPRFGGGVPLSMKAGADSAEAMLLLLSGEKLTYNPYAAKDNTLFSRFHQSICVSEIPVASKQEIKALIFDLDDTLYSEKEYVKSGYKAIAETLPEVEDCANKLWNAFVEGKNAIDTVLMAQGIFTEELKQQCLRVYREHMPEIQLYDGVREMLSELRQNKIKTGIITDGRPDGQRNKIAVLNLDKMVDEIIITDELGGEQLRKPNDIAFRIMQCKMNIPMENVVYAGDNPKKDFMAPKALGMKHIFLLNEDGLYYDAEQIQNPHVSSIAEMNNMLRKICMIG